MVERHMPLARSLAHRFAAVSEPVSDLEQVVYVALVKAVDGYDRRRGTAFTTYAVPCILGAIKRHFRDCGWAVHVPRAAKDLACRIDKLTDELATATGRVPSAAELAEHIGTTVEAVLDARHAVTANHSVALCPSHDEPNSATLEALGSDDPRLAGALDRHAIDSALATLSVRHRLVVELRFRADLTEAEIARCLGYSQAHVSRLLREALGQLRSMFDRRDELAA